MMEIENKKVRLLVNLEDIVTHFPGIIFSLYFGDLVIKEPVFEDETTSSGCAIFSVEQERAEAIVEFLKGRYEGFRVRIDKKTCDSCFNLLVEKKLVFLMVNASELTLIEPHYIYRLLLNPFRSFEPVHHGKMIDDCYKVFQIEDSLAKMILQYFKEKFHFKRSKIKVKFP
ncbi:MAG: hypothetical protein ACFFD4_19815 [Candidatus Odinarchaeota archaeon]